MKTRKFYKLLDNFHDKEKYAMSNKNLKQALNHELTFKKVQRVIKVNQKAWVKPLIWIQSWEKKSKSDLEKDISKLVNSGAFGKIMENVRKHRAITLEKTETRINYSKQEPNYHRQNKFFVKFTRHRNEKNTNSNW